MNRGSLDALETLYLMAAKGERPTLAEVIRCYTTVVLAECKTINEAAIVLAVNRVTLYRHRRDGTL